MILDNIYLKRRRSRIQNVDRSPLKRSVAKSITWRIIGTLDTMLISWFVTGKLILAISIGSIELGTKMILYVVHERAWERIRWGTVQPISAPSDVNVSIEEPIKVEYLSPAPIARYSVRGQ